MIIQIQATAALLTADEIREAIPPETMARIKGKDQSPFFQAYSIAQEGESRPKETGETQNSLILWPRKAIESIKNVLKAGLQFFKFHNKDNSTNGRPSLGEYVGHLGKEIHGKLHEIVVGYFPDKAEAQKCDICSMEADVDGEAITAAAWVVDKVCSITGIALDNSAHNVPAFKGAKMLASLQCFEDGESSKNKTGLDKPKGGEPIMTYKEAIDAIKDFNIMPHQAFTEQDLRNDRVLGAVYLDRDKFKTDYESLKTENEANKTKLTDQDKRILQADAKTRMEKMIPEGSTPHTKKYISDGFKPETLENLSDEGLKSYVDNQMKVYTENAAFFGAENKPNENNSGGTDNGENKPNENNSENEGKSKVDLAFEDAMGNDKK